MIEWTEDGHDFHGVGDHATYVVHQLVIKRTGEPPEYGKYYTARKLGDNPLRAVGGPYDTPEEAKQRAEQMEASI